MSESKHTPGPWRIGFEDGSGGLDSKGGAWITQEKTGQAIVMGSSNEFERGGIIADRSFEFDESENQADSENQYEANAHLIVAAPDLLLALQSLGSKPGGYCFCRSPEQGEAGHTGECRQANAAITKAKGTET